MFPSSGMTDIIFRFQWPSGYGRTGYFQIRYSGEKWSKPENMKYPINTNADDFAIVFNPDEPEEGFFSSNRSGEKEEMIFILS